MAAGFQSYNLDGSPQVDSTLPYMRTRTSSPTGPITAGYYRFPNPWEPGNPFGVATGMPPNPGTPVQTWVRLNVGGAFIPFANQYTANAAFAIQTDVTTPITSGYLDVYDDSGKLVWSALSAGGMPRVQGVMKFDSSTDLDSGISIPFSFSPFILSNTCMGEVSDDGVVVAWSGMAFRWTGTHLQVRWIRQNQPTFSPNVPARGGAYVPYARFAGY